MNRRITFLATLTMAAVATASPNGGPLGDFEAHGDVGSPKIAGYATYNGASQVYTLSAGGVPARRPLVLSKVAQLGGFVMEKVSAAPWGSVAVGVKVPGLV